MNSQTLFSIDVDAHLKKAASFTFGSSSHYPVELVRAALTRGAREVDIFCSSNQLQVQDNGTGLDGNSLETLTCILDPVQPPAVKESAVEQLQTRKGLGLLAIFASLPEKILVENVCKPPVGKKRIHFYKNKLETTGQCSLEEGTRITLIGKNRDHAGEKQLLQIFCQSVSNKIRLNRRVISGHNSLPRQMVTIKLSRF
ncbi:MAG: hypothetical protein GY940_20215, partial [bacterium]|nr:hypothetical protein [bacterium]